MKHTIHNQVDLYFESISFLLRIYNNESISKLKEKLVERIGDNISAEESAFIFDDIIDLYQEIEQRVQIEGPWGDLLFKKRENTPPYAHALRNYRFYKDHSAHARRNLLYELITNNETDEAEGDFVISSDEAFFGWLETTPLSVEEKYAIVLFYFQFDHLTEYLQSLVISVSEVLRERMPLFQPRIDHLIQEIHQSIAEKGVHFISEWANVHVKLEAEDTYNIYPTLDFGVMLIASEWVQGNLMTIGINVREFLRLEGEQRYRNTKQAEFFKALADNTKLSILLHLKQGSLYSGQLAGALNLTGPTISHHMNTLTQLQLVTLEKRGNRVYYELNKPIFAAYLEELRRMLLE